MADSTMAPACTVIDDAIAALTVWGSSVPRGEDLTAASAPPFQVAARAIYDLLDGAVEAAEATNGMDFNYGHALVHTLDMALWNFMSLNDAAPLSGAQLARTAAMAAGHLARALKELTIATSREVQHA